MIRQLKVKQSRGGIQGLHPGSGPGAGTTVKSMVEYFDNIFCIQANWLFGEGEVMTELSYKQLTNRNKVNVVRRGCRNTPALIEYDSLPSRFRTIVEQKVGNPRKLIEKSDVEQFIEVDSEAVSYFSHYELDDSRSLPREVQVEYYWNAVVLNAVRKTVNEKRQLHRKMNNSPSGVWQRISDNVNDLNRTRYPHTLPANPRRLQDKYNQYINEGYPSLIHRNFCNANSRIVDSHLERLILSIYCMGNKPYASWVHEDYMKFLAGVLDIVDLETGEIFDRNDFWNDKKGTYKTISEATCWNYIKQLLVGELGENMPAVVGGSSVTYMSDYFYTSIPASSEEQRGVLFGGSAYFGASAGLGCSITHYTTTPASASFGSRLCFLPGA
ncbi:MAG: hypothetical protein VB022_10905 [Rikenellaceae bacterium]|nr:hypothetical protein [Rikenellaceae bacterium]